MVQRHEYLDQLKKWKDKSVIKVITGIRRCGKSTLLELYREYLKTQGVTDDQIISINFEELEYEELLDYKSLYNFIKEKLHATKTTYIFLDEIQQVENFQKAVDSLYVKKNVDVYITGSNAYLLSGELATLLSGRYIEINMLPLSFSEFYEMRPNSDKDALLAEYMQNGGFPYIPSLGNDADMIDSFNGYYMYDEDENIDYSNKRVVNNIKELIKKIK